MALSARAKKSALVTRVMRYQTFWLPGLQKQPTGELRKVVVRSVLGGLTVDLSVADFRKVLDAGADRAIGEVIIDVTIFFGRVTLLLKTECAILIGRVDHARMVAFDNRSPNVVFEGPRDYDERPRSSPSNRVVLNVLGLGGVILLRGG